MTCKTCPVCGTSLEILEAFTLGKLFVDKAGFRIWWGERVVPLTAAERLAVIAIVRADGVPVKRAAIAEASGYDGDGGVNLASVLISRAYSKFRAIDPAFDCIESVRGQGIRWRQA